MIWWENICNVWDGGGSDGGEAVEGVVVGGGPSHRHLSLRVEHSVARSRAGEERDGDFLAEQLGAEVQRGLQACQYLGSSGIYTATELRYLKIPIEKWRAAGGRVHCVQTADTPTHPED